MLSFSLSLSLFSWVRATLDEPENMIIPQDNEKCAPFIRMIIFSVCTFLCGLFFCAGITPPPRQGDDFRQHTHSPREKNKLRGVRKGARPNAAADGTGHRKDIITAHSLSARRVTRKKKKVTRKNGATARHSKTRKNVTKKFTKTILMILADRAQRKAICQEEKKRESTERRTGRRLTGLGRAARGRQSGRRQ